MLSALPSFSSLCEGATEAVAEGELEEPDGCAQTLAGPWLAPELCGRSLPAPPAPPGSCPSGPATAPPA